MLNIRQQLNCKMNQIYNRFEKKQMNYVKNRRQIPAMNIILQSIRHSLLQNVMYSHEQRNVLKIALNYCSPRPIAVLDASIASSEKDLTKFDAICKQYNTFF